MVSVLGSVGYGLRRLTRAAAVFASDSAFTWGSAIKLRISGSLAGREQSYNQVVGSGLRAFSV